MGYTFTLAGAAQNFTANGDPSEMGVTGNKGFFTNSSGVIRFAEGAAADEGSTPIGEAAGGV